MNTRRGISTPYLPPFKVEASGSVVGPDVTPVRGTGPYRARGLSIRPTSLARISEPIRERVGVDAHLLPALIVLSMPISTLLIVLAYAEAAMGDTGQKHYDLFWSGVFAFLIPAGLRLCGRAASRAERLVLLLTCGFLNVLPKYLTSPNYFLYHDELAHWRQAQMIYSTGRLFVPNPSVYISQYFPGLESMSVVLRDLTGITTFQVAVVLVVTTHCAVLAGIFLIGETLTNSTRVGAIAALIYSLNPGFMYFDSQYSYESIAFVLVVWTVVAAVKMQGAESSREERWAWFAIGLVLAATCIETHHVSTYFLIGILWLISCTTIFRAARGRAGRSSTVLLGVFSAVVTLGATCWLIVVAPEVISYLAQPVDGALAQIEQILRHQQQGRVIFSGSSTPAYEHYSAFGSVALALFGAAGGLVALRRCSTRPAAQSALAMLGLLYFGSLPLVLTGSGSEGVHRSWTFTYIGLSLLVALAVMALKQWTERGRGPLWWITSGLLAAGFCVVQVGNVGMNTDEFYRFPGPYVFGTDTRSITAESLTLASWFRASQGTGNKVVADYYTSQILSSFAQQWTPLATQGFPIWQLYFDPNAPNKSLLHELEVSNYRYLVVDERMTQSLPYLGIYFQNGERGPDGQSIDSPPSSTIIDRFARVPWAIRIYQSNNFSVYQLDFAAFKAQWNSSSTTIAIPTRSP